MIIAYKHMLISWNSIYSTCGANTFPIELMRYYVHKVGRYLGTWVPPSYDESSPEAFACNTSREHKNKQIEISLYLGTVTHRQTRVLLG